VLFHSSSNVIEVIDKVRMVAKRTEGQCVAM